MRTPTGSRWSSPSPTSRPRWRLARVVVAFGVVTPILTLAHPAAADSVADKQAEAARLERAIQDLSLKQSQLAEVYDQARLRVETVDAKLAAAKINLANTDRQLATARSRVRDMAINSYVHGGSATQLTMFVPKTTQELTVRSTYMRAIAADTNDAVDALRATHAQIGEEQSRLAAAQADANKTLDAADAARRSAQAADTAERALLAKVQGDLSTLVADASAQRQRALAARLQAEAARNARASTARFQGGGLGSSGGGAPSQLPPPSPGAAGAVAEAQRMLGRPYMYGGAGPDSFDCSGLTAWAWGHAGHSLPHSAAAQYDVTTHIPVADLQPGDLVFYGSPPHHVGIYVGSGQMIDALHSGTYVEYDSIYVESDIIGGGRVN